MSDMSSFADALPGVLARHGSDMAPEEFLAILTDAVDSTDALTAHEQRVLVAEGGIGADAVAPGAQAEGRRQIAVRSAEADATATRDGYTTSEVAERFTIAPANVRRLVRRGGLYVVAHRTRNREHIFPRWQFTADGPLPGLDLVLVALPDDLHPLDVAAWMTAPQESLRGRTPVGWLAGGGDPDRVAALADELGRS